MLHIFPMACAGQYKNCKNMYNLCHHKSDYDLDAINGCFLQPVMGNSHVRYSEAACCKC